jgi:SNF2 family DNA or RNA helicase
MGIDLSSADELIFYNIDFSFVQYWQARARLQSLQRTKPVVVNWLFTENGIEKKVYDIVLKKKTYTSYYFKRDYMRAS